MKSKIAVIGAGVGGLSVAARLASRGHEVDVYEKLSSCGGRNNIIEDKGFKFDLGPSFVLMPDFFEEVFKYCGKSLKDYLDLRVLDPSYKIFYPDGRELNVLRDSQRTKEELEKFEEGASAAFDKFIQEVSNIYKQVKPLLYKCFTPRGLFNPSYWPLITKINAFKTYWQLAKKFFKSEELCYAFTFEAMFIGVSPFNSPAFYSIISYTDHVQKIYHPMGGMYRIPIALENLAKSFGARFHYNSEVASIFSSNNRVGFSLNNVDKLVDKAVVNADYAYSQGKLLRRKLKKYQYSCSVFLIYLGLKKKVPGVCHHNLFFAEDLRNNLKQIFNEGVFPEEGSFYLHVPTVTDQSLAPREKDIFYILIPVPNLNNCKQKINEVEQNLRSGVFKRINQRLGINLEDLIEVEHRFYPQDFISRYNIEYGATFGLAHNFMQSAFFRPANFDSKINNLYYVGASTQPGGGLPVVMASSRIVADLIDNSTNNNLRR
jgi:phytoene desaturase